MVLSLLIASLIERDLRDYAKNTKLEGWDRKLTDKPTLYMLSRKFRNILIWKLGQQRALMKPLSPAQEAYLKAMDLSKDIYTQMIKSGSG